MFHHFLKLHYLNRQGDFFNCLLPHFLDFPLLFQTYQTYFLQIFQMSIINSLSTILYKLKQKKSLKKLSSVD